MMLNTPVRMRLTRINTVSYTHLFGPQKGATEAMIVELDRNLAHYADVIKTSLQVDVKSIPGAGADVYKRQGLERRNVDGTISVQ